MQKDAARCSSLQALGSGIRRLGCKVHSNANVFEVGGGGFRIGVLELMVGGVCLLVLVLV